MKILIRSILVILLFSQISYSQVTEQWVQRFTSDSSRAERVNDMAIDPQGNVYITGSQKEGNFPFTNTIEALTVKYNSQGVLQWIQNYRAPNNNGAFCRAIHVDAVGNVYVTGENALYSGGSNEMLVIKYSTDGTQLWSYRFQYVNLFYAGGYDIITDASGNVYVTGEYGNGGNNLFLVKFGPSGNLINQTFYNSGGSDGGRKIALDGNGKIIVGGNSNLQDTSSYLLLKYEQNLDFVFSRNWKPGDQSVTVISDMSIDLNSNIILTGTSNLDFATVMYNYNGDFLWSRTYNSTEGLDLCHAVVTDLTGNIYITGQSGVSGLPFTQNFCTIKYNTNGVQQWVQKYNGGSIPDGYSAYDIAADDSANVYVTGLIYSNQDIGTIKYNTGGVFQWEMKYNGTGNGIDVGVNVGVDMSRNVYVSGNSSGLGSGNDIVTIKYVQTTIGIQNISNEVPKEFSLSQNYPNPFNPSTKIKFDVLPGIRNQSANVLLVIYDAAGNEIQKLVNESLSAGTYETEWNAANYSSGVYFYKLKTDNYSETKKMMLVN